VAFGFSVAVVDNNGNEMVRIGQYGNPDNGGPGSGRPAPELPIGFTRYVTGADRSVYISDHDNARILRADYDYSGLWSSVRGMIKSSIEAAGGRNPGNAGLSVSVHPEPVRSRAVVTIGNRPDGVVSVRVVTPRAG